jgi:hypothetical protein
MEIVILEFGNMIIAVDFDGTCVTHEFPKMGMDIPGAVETLKALIAAGHQIMLWTMRADGGEHPDVLLEAVGWFQKHDIHLWAVNQNPEQGWSKSHKQYAHLYIDDAALGCPLVNVAESDRPVADWSTITWYLRYSGYLPKQVVCVDCGVKHLTEAQIAAGGQATTFHKGRCDECGELKSVTDTRHYNYLKKPEESK